MISSENSLISAQHRKARPSTSVMSARLYVYVACTSLALLTGYLLGKDMRWDTLDYHFYAGFSALHNRFSRDYFAAGPQSYFNPYAYAPFYVLVKTGLPALVAASILAVAQSGILWLTYELAREIAPPESARVRFCLCLCAVALAFANPILINQFGSSYADIITAEVVLAGWLLLVRAIREPSTSRILGAGLLLGGASALKLTNSVHALSGIVMVLFIPTSWRVRLRGAILFGLALSAAFVVVNAPWSVHLAHQFGNPLFPLLNGIFRSPDFPTAPMLDYRFIPDSFADALWRPFAIVAPLNMVDDELPSPDLRYALLLVLTLLLVMRWIWRKSKRVSGGASTASAESASSCALAALGSGFLIDWILWLKASGNGRYFLAPACVAAVLGIALTFRLFREQPRARNYFIALIMAAQAAQLCIGTAYRRHVQWDGGPWFEVSLPAGLDSNPSLYLSLGVQSNSFIVPFLPRKSGFVNVGGDYVLGSTPANYARVQSLIREFSPNVRIIVPDHRPDAGRSGEAPDATSLDAALFPFRLRVDTRDCSNIVVPAMGPQSGIVFTAGAPSPLSGGGLKEAVPGTEHLLTCRLVRDTAVRTTLSSIEGTVNVVLDRLEDACPTVFQPARSATLYLGGTRDGGLWARRYANTDITAWVSGGWVKFMDPLRSGRAAYIGREDAFEHAPVRVVCGRRNEHYFARLVPAHQAVDQRAGRPQT